MKFVIRQLFRTLLTVCKFCDGTFCLVSSERSFVSAKEAS